MMAMALKSPSSSVRTDATFSRNSIHASFCLKFEGSSDKMTLPAIEI
jgi:hypothetical protein